jgi:hypothetical protein
VNRVGQERDTSRKIENDNLDERGDKQPDERPFNCPQSSISGGDGRVNRAMHMAVRAATVIVVVIAMSASAQLA